MPPRICRWVPGISTVTDFNNSLKLGYDPENEEYPSWIDSQACCA